VHFKEACLIERASGQTLTDAMYALLSALANIAVGRWRTTAASIEVRRAIRWRCLGLRLPVLNGMRGTFGGRTYRISCARTCARFTTATWTRPRPPA